MKHILSHCGLKTKHKKTIYHPEEHLHLCFTKLRFTEILILASIFLIFFFLILILLLCFSSLAVYISENNTQIEDAQR